MSNIFYNVATQDITNGLKDLEVSSGQDYFILLSAPTNANVKVKLNSNTAPAIPIYEFWQFKSENLENLYISCDAVAGASITYGQADGNVEITTNPQIGSIDSITTVNEVSSFGSSLITALDKVFNPYELPTYIQSETNSTSFVTILDVTLDCDKIELIFEGGRADIANGGYVGGMVNVILDNKRLCSNGGFTGGSNYASFNTATNLIIENVRGKRLFINGSNYTTSHFSYFTLKKYNLKA